MVTFWLGPFIVFGPPYSNVDASPLGSEGEVDEQIEHSIDIIVLNSQEPIVDGGLGTQLEDGIDALTQM